ncbi:hypothetical protein BDR04DRAFT_1157402 [Suillus decipiens]|nr:hypothetical protein BDR04DRAFT_1157402 [Suillus decipiens]
MSTKPLYPPKYDLDSIMESESELDIPPKPQTLLQVIEPFVCDLNSIMESESELNVPLKHTPIKPIIKPLICDLNSITESESELDIPPKPQTPQQVMQKKSFFATPNPPPPGSIYWKYVLHEEDARWYD